MSDEGDVSCICPHGLAGSRCERKDTSHRRKNNNGFNSDTDEVNNTVITVLVSMFSIAGIILLVLGLVYFYRKTRLGGAFKHRRMAENLLSNNIEFSNQMYMPEEEEDDSDIIIMRDANNFSNPVYDSMFGPGQPGHQASLVPNETLTGASPSTQENQGLLSKENINLEEQDDPESVDLLTEKHRGNISL